MAEQSDIPTPAAPEQLPPTPVETDTDKLKNLWREHGQPVLIGVGLAAAIFLAIAAYRNYRQSATERASMLLNTAKNPEQLQQIVNQYGNTPAAPAALLTLASEQFMAGQYDLARNSYAQFAQKYPKHPLFEAAAFGQAQCLEAGGRIEAAMDAYASFTKAHTNNYLTAPAQIGRGRCLEQLGRFKEAKAVYEDFLVAHTNSPWATQVESAAKFVDKEIRAEKKKPAAAAATTPAPSAKPPVSPVNPSAPAPSKTAAAR